MLKECEVEDKMRPILFGNPQMYSKVRQYELQKIEDSWQNEFSLTYELLSKLQYKFRLEESNSCKEFGIELDELVNQADYASLGNRSRRCFQPMVILYTKDKILQFNCFKHLCSIIAN